MSLLGPAFPSGPVITGQDHLRLGVESTLTCQVSEVYPAELLTFTWIRGDVVLPSSVGNPVSSSVQSEYRFTPLNQDSGRNISCRATLELLNLPAEDRTRETTVPLNPLCESKSSDLPDLPPNLYRLSHEKQKSSFPSVAEGTQSGLGSGGFSTSPPSILLNDAKKFLFFL